MFLCYDSHLMGEADRQGMRIYRLEKPAESDLIGVSTWPTRYELHLTRVSIVFGMSY